MERTDYPALLAALTPAEAVDVLSERVNHVGRLNVEVAEWLAERRRLEEVYANGLRKLARKQILGVDLGIFSVPWSTLTSATENQAESHTSLAAKIDTDVERPLREFVKSSREMQAMTTVQGNLGSLAKDVDAAHTKVDKAQGKDSSKLASATTELEQAQGRWEAQAPYVFETLQALDEARLNHLRDVLTQLQTHEVDQVEKDRVSAEQCLNVLLNVEIADEIKTFSLKALAGRTKIRTESTSRILPTPSRPSHLAPTQSATSGGEESSQRAASIQDDEKKKGPLKGLKRLSTVMGRKKDRSSKVPSQLEPMAEAAEIKSKSSPFSAFSRSSKKKDSSNLESLPETASPPRRPYSPLRVGSEAFEPSELERGQGQNGTQGSTTNGVAAGSAAEALQILSNGDRQTTNETAQPQTAAPARQDSEGYSLPASDVDPITRAQQEAAASAGDDAVQQYNVNIRSAPIAEEGGDVNAALADVATKLQMQAPPPQRRAGTVRGRRDNRASAYVTGFEPPTPPPFTRAKSAEDTNARNLAPADSPALPATSVPPVNFNPNASTSSAFSTLPTATEAASPFKPAARALTADTTGDNHSIRSGRSLSSTASQGHKHPDLTSTGLNVSIIETVNARFEQGKLTTSSLLGEIALAYIPSGFSTPFATENIRLTNFSLLDKVAPNPAFVSPAPTGRDGDYAINLSSISKAQVAFKYQTRLDDANAHAPLLISPAYKIEPNQASVIIHYSLNPGFKLDVAQSITLTNVMLALTLEGAKATGCQSRPVGTFSRERNLIFWQLGEITLRAGAAPEKLLARFATESQATSGNVEARWEITGASVGSGLAVSVQGQAGAASAGSDPFADDDAQSAWSTVQAVKKLTSGNYTAK